MASASGPASSGGTTIKQFFDLAELTGLFGGEALETLKSQWPEARRGEDAHALARELVQQGKLTKYQGAGLYQGKPKGLTLGSYVFLDRLGAGGLGTVYKAQHRQSGQVVAVKVLSPTATRSSDAVKRFQREAEAAGRLNHPNIVRALDTGEIDGQHFIVMEYVEGVDLSHYVKKQGPMALEQAVGCTVQVARALAYAHEQGIVHRDIKPGNILLSLDGQIKILDMGLARLNDPAMAGTAQAAEGLTQTGQVMGTVDYMAPEQALHTRLADARADVYSLGCTFYRLLTGNVPYDADSLVMKILAHREQPIPSLRAFNPHIPEATDRVFQRMLAKNPDDRYQSMNELADDLERSLSAATARVAKVATPLPISDLPPANDSSSSLSITLSSAPNQPASVTGSPSQTMATFAAAMKSSPAINTSRVARRKRGVPAWSYATAALLLVGGVAAVVVMRGNSNGEIAANNPQEKPPPVAVAPALSNSTKKRLPNSDAPAPDPTLGPTPAAPTQTAVANSPAADDRELAKWCLDRDLQIYVHDFSTDRPRLVTQIEELHNGPMYLMAVLTKRPGQVRDDDLPKLAEGRDISALVLHGPTITDDCISHLQSFPILQMAVFFDTSITDAGLAGLKKIKGLTQLSLYNSQVTDAGLDALAGLANLKYLNLNRLAVTDAAVAKLRPLTQLKFLYLGSTKITDASVPVITSFAGLQRLVIKGTEISDAGRQRIAAALPQCQLDPPTGPPIDLARPARLKQSSVVASNSPPAPPSTTSPPAGPGTPAAPAIVTSNAPASASKPAQPAQPQPPSVASGSTADPVTPQLPELRLPLSADVTLSMRQIPAGSFMMGSPASEPGRKPEEIQHHVTLTKSFYLSTTEVAEEVWTAVMGKPSQKFSRDPRFPAKSTRVEAEQFISTLNKGPHSQYLRFRFPTEAEWEYAARAGTSTAYFWGDDPSLADQYAVFVKSGGLQRVATKKPNAWGLYDMLGNKLEFCQDLYSDTTYTEAAVVDPMGATTPKYNGTYVLRGGANYQSVDSLRCASRQYQASSAGDDGCRLACDVIGTMPAAFSVPNLPTVASNNPPASGAGKDSVLGIPSIATPSSNAAELVPAKERRDVPDTKAIEEALKLVRGDLFADGYAKAKKPEERAALARTLQEYAEKVSDDPVGRFVILREARDLAAEGGEVSLAASICFVAASDYKVEALVWLAEACEAAQKRVLPSTVNKSIAGALLTKVDEAIQADEFDPIERLLSAALAAARKSQDQTTIKAIAERSKQFDKDKQQREAIAKARDTLVTKPDDPAANLIVGKQLCFVEGSWTEGLACLAKSNDSILKELAEKSLVPPTGGDELVALADQWWTKAEKAAWQTKKELMAGAHYWYGQAADKVTGLSKTKVDKRIADTRAAAEALAEVTGRSTKADYLSLPLAPNVALTLRLIPAGAFAMGSPETEVGRKADEVQHRVTLTRPFFLGVTEFTEGHWTAVMGTPDRGFQGDPLAPAASLNWKDAQRLLNALNKTPFASFLRFRAPTEAEWEYAARAGTTTTYFWGDNPADADKYAVVDQGVNASVHRVATKNPNAWGLYDMLGNTSEFCADNYSPAAYTSAAAIDPLLAATTGPDSTRHVLRGGAAMSPQAYFRCATRGSQADNAGSGPQGIRIACDVVGKIPPNLFLKQAPSVAPQAAAPATPAAPPPPAASSPAPTSPKPPASTTVAPITPPAVNPPPQAPGGGLDIAALQKPTTEGYTQLAEWVFQRGGGVWLTHMNSSGGSNSFSAKDTASLPTVPFTISGISFDRKSPINDADLKVIGSLPWISNVSLTSQPITDVGLVELANLTKLNILTIDSPGRISDSAMAQVLSKATRLQTLRIRNAGLNGACLASLSELKKLTNLKLEENPIGDRELAAIAPLQQLTSLALENIRLSDVGMVHLRELTSLSYLNLTGNKISDAGLSNLAALSKLSNLSLTRTSVNGSGLSELQNLPLTSLSLDSTQFTDAALDTVARFGQLKGLYLHSTRVTDVGLAKLAAHPTLSTLNVSFCPITDASLATFAKMPNLKTVFAFNKPFSAAALQAFQAQSQAKVIN